MDKNEVRTSDVYVAQGDCLDLMKNLPADSIDLTVTSPPYDNLRDYHGYTFNFEGIAQELYRITKPGGVIVWIVNDATVNGSETGTSFRQALRFKEIGFNLHDTMIWKKPSTVYPEKNRYYQCFEYMFILSKGKPKSTNIICDRKNKFAGDTVHGTGRKRDGHLEAFTTMRKGAVIKEYGVRFNVWEMPPVVSNTERTGHPAQFPEALVRDHIITWSNEGDTVFDPMMGSGTTGKVAVTNGRNFIGFEISDEYFAIADRRIAEAAKQIQ